MPRRAVPGGLGRALLPGNKKAVAHRGLSREMVLTRSAKQRLHDRTAKPSALLSYALA